MLTRFLPCLLIATFLTGPLDAQEAKKKPLAVEDLYLVESVKSPTLFPKEDKLVYERVWIDPKKKAERHSLWLVDGKRENRKPLEKDEPDGRSPVVSPDGEWIAFLSTRRDPPPFPNQGRVKYRAPEWAPPYSDPGVDVWLYHVKSAQVVPLGPPRPERPWGHVFHDGFYGRVAFSPDSKRLVFVADEAKDPRTKEEIENEVAIVRPDQGEGYTGYRPAQIWVVDLDWRAEPRKGPVDDKDASSTGSLRSSARRLTDDDIWYGDPQWSPDGKSLVVVANKTKDRESVRYSINKNFDLYLIDVATKKQTQLTTNPGPDVSPRWSPDGKQIAYLSSPRNGPHRDVFDLCVSELKGGAGKTRYIYQGKDVEKVPHPAFPLPTNSWQDADSFWIQEELTSFTPTSLVEIRTGVLIPERLGDRFRVLRDRAAQIQAEHNKVIESRNRGYQERVEWDNEGFGVSGILTRPADGVARPPYKLLVLPHGGPHGRVVFGWDFTAQLFAAHGYAVFQPNFRGSTGYGAKFLDADRLDLGGGDMRDILTGINHLVKEGKVDPKRQFVYGTSYGGFMASWLVGHTHQFRAAVAQNAVTDMNMMYALSDLQSWTTWELGGKPWEQPERYRKHSPLTYADKVKTPTLILHARDDRRCPLPMGKAFHQALLANGVPTEMVIYPDEGHAIRQPRHREDVYRRVLAWFEKHDVK
jgi:dipeptidyl aminopeptidase/acylaminoacyl peptidase